MLTIVLRKRDKEAEIRCQTPEEAVAVVRAFGILNGSDAGTSMAHSVRRTRRSATRVDRPQGSLTTSNKRAVDMISAVYDAGEKGLPPDSVARAGHLGTTKGLGVMVGHINRLLRPGGLDFGQVVVIKRSTRGEKTWTPGPRIKEGLSTLKGG